MQLARSSHMLAAFSCISLLASSCSGAPDLSGSYSLSIASQSISAQLYLVQHGDDDTAYRAVLDGAPCSGKVDDDTLSLDGCSLSAPGLPNMFEHSGPIYDHLALPISSNKLTSKFHASNYTGEASADGTLTPATLRPQLRATPVQSPVLTARPTLPWDTLKLDFGDGVAIDESTLSDALDLAADSGNEVKARWRYSSYEVPGTSRKLSVSALADLEWPEIIGDTITFSLAKGTPDSAGSKSQSKLSVDHQLAQIGAPTNGWEFDSRDDLTKLAHWGDGEIVSDTKACSGSCLQLGDNLVACAEPGLAGQLDTRDASKIVVRVRATAFRSALTHPLELGVSLGEPEASEQERSDVRETLAPRGQQDDTDWQDIELPLNDEQKREHLPFELRVIYGCPWYWTTSPTPKPSTNAMVLIDSISLE